MLNGFNPDYQLYLQDGETMKTEDLDDPLLQKKC